MRSDNEREVGTQLLGWQGTVNVTENMFGVGETEGERMGWARGEAGMSMTRASRLQLSDKNRNQAISRRPYDVWRMFSKVGRS